MFIGRSNSDAGGESGMKFPENGKVSAPGRLDISCPAVLKHLSHEMRTHMNAVVAFSFIMNKEGYSEREREEFSDQVMKSCEQLITLFDNFLDTAMIDAGSESDDLKIIRPDIYLNDLFADLRNTLIKEKRDDVLLVTENQYTRAEEITVDTNRLSRVIRCLFHNALHNTCSGYIKIGYSLEERNLNCRILDSGLGFAGSLEFLQTTDLNGSLGKFPDVYQAISIVLARNLIDQMKGTICIERNGPGGSAIGFSVPLQPAVSMAKENKKLSSGMITI